MLNIINSWFSFDKLSVDIISLLNRCQCLLFDILLDPLFFIRPLPLRLVLLVIYHQQDIGDPKVLYEKLKLFQIESVIGIG